MRRALAIELGSRNDGRVDRVELQKTLEAACLYDRVNFTQTMTKDSDLFQELPRANGKWIVGWQLTAAATLRVSDAAAVIAAWRAAAEFADTRTQHGVPTSSPVLQENAPAHVSTEPRRGQLTDLLAQAQMLVGEMQRASNQVHAELDHVRVDLAQARLDLASANQRCSELQRDCARLSEKLAAPPALAAPPVPSITKPSESLKAAAIERSRPKSLLGLIEEVASRNPDRIALTHNARTTARRACINEWYAQEEARLRDLFDAIVGPLHDMAFDGSLVPECFRAATGHWLALTEGRATRRDKRLMNLRKYDYDNRQFEVEAHLGYGRLPPRLVRVYLSFDRLKSRIVLFHVGDHMETAGTRRCGLPPRGY